MGAAPPPELVVSRWRIAVLSTVSGTIGVVVTRLPGPRWLVVVLVLTVTLALLQLTRSRLGPAVSAAVWAALVGLPTALVALRPGQRPRTAPSV